MIQELHVIDYMGGRVGLVCFESLGEDHVSFHIIFSVFSLNLHSFTCHVENTFFRFFVNTHLFTYEHNIYVRTYNIYTYIYIGTYLSSEGSKDPSEINFGPILGQKNWGKKIGINAI